MDIGKVRTKFVSYDWFEIELTLDELKSKLCRSSRMYCTAETDEISENYSK